MDENSPEMRQTRLFATIGAALSMWTAVELQMANLFSIISDMKNDEKAAALFGGIISFEVRLGVLDRAMLFEDISKIEAEMWNRLSARLSKFYKKRHEIAHFMVVDQATAAVAAPFLTLHQFIDGASRRLTKLQIEERSQKFNELAQALCWFHGQAFKRRWPPEGGPLPQPLEPPIVTQLRDAANQILEARTPPPPPSPQ